MLSSGVSYRRSPTARLLAGLAVTLSAVAVYSAFTFIQLRGLEELQTTAIDRNRLDSLLLLRIQGNLNSIALTMRDMLEAASPIRSPPGRALSTNTERSGGRPGAGGRAIRPLGQRSRPGRFPRERPCPVLGRAGPRLRPGAAPARKRRRATSSASPCKPARRPFRRPWRGCW